MNTLQPLGVARPPEIENVPDSVQGYVQLLESALLNRQQVGTKNSEVWSVERWIAVASFVGMVMVSIFAVGARWNGIDALEQRMAKLETRMDSMTATSDNIYVRRDINDERLKTINDKLDLLGIDIKSIKANMR